MAGRGEHVDLGVARLAVCRPVGRHRTCHDRRRHRLGFAVRDLDGIVRVAHLLEGTAAGKGRAAG